ncbi:hypothetical protein V1515DRAFT_576076 [Lipomyces mesembrius]
MSTSTTEDGLQEQPVVPRRPRPMMPTIPRRPRPKTADSGSDGSLSSSLPTTPFSEQVPDHELSSSELSSTADDAHPQAQYATSLPVAIPSIPRRPHSPSVNLRRPRDLYETQQQVAEIEMDISRTLAENEKNFGETTTESNEPDRPGIYDGMEHIVGLLERNSEEREVSESYSEAELSESEPSDSSANAGSYFGGIRSPQAQNPRGSQVLERPQATTSPTPRIPDRPRSTHSTPSTEAEEQSKTDLPMPSIPHRPASTPKIPNRPTSPKVPERPGSAKSSYEPKILDRPTEQATIPQRPSSRPTRQHANVHVHVSPNALVIDPSSEGEPGQIHTIPTFARDTDSDLWTQVSSDNPEANTVFDIAAHMADEELHHPAELGDKFRRTVLTRPNPLTGLLEPTATPADTSPVFARDVEGLVSPTESVGQRDVLESLIHNYMEEGTPVLEEPNTLEAVSEKGYGPVMTDKSDGDDRAAPEPVTEEATVSVDETGTEGEESPTDGGPAYSAGLPNEAAVAVEEGLAVADTPKDEKAEKPTTEEVMPNADEASLAQEATLGGDTASKVTEPSLTAEPSVAEPVIASLGESAQPELPQRPSRPQVPRRPKPALSLSRTESAATTPTHEPSGFSPKHSPAVTPPLENVPSKSLGESSTGPRVTKPKPPPPARPNKLSGIRAAFAKDLESRFGKAGPMPFMMPRPAKPAQVSSAAEPEDAQMTEDRPAPALDSKPTRPAPAKETKLDDVRKGRARGPRGRKLPAPTELPGGWGFSSVVTVWELWNPEPELLSTGAQKDSILPGSEKVGEPATVVQEEETTLGMPQDVVNKPDVTSMEASEEPSVIIFEDGGSSGKNAAETVDESELAKEEAAQERTSTVKLEHELSPLVDEVPTNLPLEGSTEDNDHDAEDVTIQNDDETEVRPSSIKEPSEPEPISNPGPMGRAVDEGLETRGATGVIQEGSCKEVTGDAIVSMLDESLDGE